MGLFSLIFGSKEERTKKMCMNLYQKAKKQRPGKSERDYLKIVLITKPPFDYQLDAVINEVLDSCSTIDELSDYIVEYSAGRLCDFRERNICDHDMSKRIDSKNKQFFREFWHS